MVLSNIQLFSTSVKATDNTITIDKTKTYQEIWGFGAAANHPVNDLMGSSYSAATKNEILDKLFNTTGDLSTGFSIVRWEINPYLKSDSSAQNALQATVHPDANTWDWDTDKHQKWFANEAVKRYSGMQFYAVPWSPPYWMKDNATNTLKKEHYQDFADYVAIWLDKYTNGVPFSAADPTAYKYNFKWVSVQNEPDLSTAYASCVYDHSTDDIGQVAIKVKDSVVAKGLSNIKVGAPEGSTRLDTQKYLMTMSDEAKAKLDFIPTHDYGPTADLKTYASGLPIFNAEVCYTSANNPEMGDGILEAENVYKDLVNGEPGFLRWWFVGTGTDGQSLVNIDNTSGTYITSKRLYTLGQFARFMRPGDTRIDAITSNPNLKVVATKNSNNNSSIVVINDTGDDYTTTVNGLDSNIASIYRTSANEDINCLGGQAITNGQLTYNFPAKSVTTIVEGTNDAPSTVHQDTHMKSFVQDPAQDPNKLYPTDDAFIRNGTFVNNNFSISSTLEIKRQSYGEEPNYTKKGLLKFDLNKLAVPFESITLHVKAKNESNKAMPGIGIFGSDNTNWSESNVTWNTAPKLKIVPINTFDITNGDYKYYDIDITSYAKERKAIDGKLTLGIQDTLGANQNLYVYSKDNDYTNRPYVTAVPSLWPANSSLTATDITENGMKLSWTPCQSVNGITSYSIYQNDNFITTVYGNTFNYDLTGLNPGTEYSLQVRATDGSGRVTKDGPMLKINSEDVTEPTWLASSILTSHNVSATAVTLSWPQAIDNAAVTQYEIYKDGNKINTVSNQITSYDVTGLTPGKTYNFIVKAKDAKGNLSQGISTAVTTVSSVDVTSPYWSNGIKIEVSNLSGTSTTLSWTAANDDKGITGYKIYKDGVYLTSVSGNSYNVTALSPDTSYNFKVEAYDAASNLSSGGPSVSLKTTSVADASAPGWIASGATIEGTNILTNKVTLTWHPLQAVDNVGVTAFRLFNGNTEITTVPSDVATFEVTGLNENTSYNFKVEAGDSSGNWSTSGPTVTVKTAVSADTEAPAWSKDRYLNFSNVTTTSVNLTWKPASDNIAVTSYRIYNNGNLAATVDGNTTSYAVTGLALGSTNTFKVEAGDVAGNWTTTGPTITAKTFASAVLNAPITIPISDNTYVKQDNTHYNPATDTELHLKGDVSAGSTSNRRIFLKFDLSSITKSVNSATLGLYYEKSDTTPIPAGTSLSIDAWSTTDAWTSTSLVTWAGMPAGIAKLSGVSNQVGGVDTKGLKTLDVTTFVDAERNGDKVASFRIEEGKNANQRIYFWSSNYSNASLRPYLTVVTQDLPTDITAPVWTSGQITASNVKPDSVDLAWTGASDDIGIDNYKIYQDNALIATVSGDTTSFNVSGLTPNTSHIFKVNAYDGVNESSTGPSTPVTTAVVDTNAPTWSNDTLTSSNVSRFGTNLTWTPAQDNYGVVSYRIYQGNNSTAIVTLAGNINTYDVTELTPGTAYSFKVEAVDSAGNLSTTGPTATVNTVAADITNPTWAANVLLTATNISNNGAMISWSAASDDTQVTGYNVYKDNVLIASLSNNISSYYISALQGNTNYSFSVKAVDAAGNLSNAISAAVTTLQSEDLIAPQWLTGSRVYLVLDNSGVKLKWDSAVDNTAVQSYKIFKDEVMIAEVEGSVNEYVLNDTIIDTAYSFRIEAKDISNNLTVNGLTAVRATSNDSTLSAITLNDVLIVGFAADNTDYNVILPAGTKVMPTVAVVMTNTNASMALTQDLVLPGKTSIVVTAGDGTTTKTYNINFTVAQPTSTGGNETPSDNGGNTGGSGNTGNNGNTNTVPVQVVLDNSGTAPKVIINFDSALISKDKVNEVKPNMSDTTKALELKVKVDNIKGGTGSLALSANKLTMSIPFSIMDLSKVDSGAYARLEQTSSSSDDSLKVIKGVGEVFNFNLALYNNEGAKLSEVHEFAQGKVKINIQLTDAQIKNLSLSKLAACYYDEAKKSWEYVGGSYDSATKIFSFETTHFSKYTIAEMSTAPVFNEVAAQNVDQGNFLQLRVNATSANNMSLTYTASNLPTGASFDAVNQSLNWTPAIDQAGRYSISFNATDGVTVTKKYVTVVVRDVSAVELVEKALVEKDFYHFNIAYYKVVKLSDEKEKAENLDKLATIHDLVWNADIANINKILENLVATGSGKIYDDVQTVINATNLSAVDKGYLLGEVTSWGKKLVFTDAYKAAVDALMCVADKKDADSISKAEAAIAKVTNNYSKEYLLEELANIKIR
jgi:O-glycosyl hydrolase/chitodextrinase